MGRRSTSTVRGAGPGTVSVGDQARARLVAALGVDDRRMELAGIPTAVLEGGSGPPIVLLHGQGEFAATWGAVLPALQRTHRVVAPDLPGHGATGLGDVDLDVGPVLRWLDALIEETCVAPPVLVGHLLGGSIALRYVVEHGDRIRSLVLVDSLGLARYRPAPSFTAALAAFVVRPTERSRDRLFDRCFVDHDDVRAGAGELWEPMAAYALDRIRGPNLKPALRRLMPRIGNPGIPPEDLDRITVPTALIHGRHDLQVRVAVAEQASVRHGWPLQVIDGVADDPAAEAPGAFLEALHTALGRGRSTT
jgi:pimeloyl-ACP methyl ester carboxylesterase